MFSMLLKFVAVCIAILAALAFVFVFLVSGLTTRYLPDERFAVGNLGVIVSKRESCWEGCSIVATSRVTWRGHPAGRRLFPGNPELGTNLRMSAALILPQKGMLVTSLRDWNEGELIVGITDAEDGPRLDILAGTLESDGKTYARAGADADLARRTLAYTRLGVGGWERAYDPDRRYSFHGHYWIDYASEEVHPVARLRHDAGHAVALSADRKTLFVFYPSQNQEHAHLLCSAGGPDGAGECVVFEAGPASMPDLKQSMPPIAAPAPNDHAVFADGRPRAARLAAWLAPKFVLDRVGPRGEILLRPGADIVRRAAAPLEEARPVDRAGTDQECGGSPATADVADADGAREVVSGTAPEVAPGSVSGSAPGTASVTAESAVPDAASPCARAAASRRARRLPAPVT